MTKLGVYLDDVITILEEGRDCSRSKREKGTYDKYMRIRKREIKVVVTRATTIWNDEPCWLIIHVGDYRER
jgi:hypothetical protein